MRWSAASKPCCARHRFGLLCHSRPMKSGYYCFTMFHVHIYKKKITAQASKLTWKLFHRCNGGSFAAFITSLTICSIIIICSISFNHKIIRMQEEKQTQENRLSTSMIASHFLSLASRPLDYISQWNIKDEKSWQIIDVRLLLRYSFILYLCHF